MVLTSEPVLITCIPSMLLTLVLSPLLTRRRQTLKYRSREDFLRENVGNGLHERGDADDACWYTA